MLESDLKDLKRVMQDVNDSMIRIDSEKEFIKDTINELSEKHMLDKKVLKKVASILHKQNMAEVQASNNDVEELYEDLAK
jgi:uncharacterized protein YqgQ